MFFFQCNAPKKADKPLSADPARIDQYTGSLYQDNYVWGGAMNLCWTMLCEAVIHSPIELDTDDQPALEMANSLNHPVCTTKDLDAPSYYVKAGLGSRTLEAINRECKAKFPQKTFPDLTFDLADDDIISYAYFYKKVAYATQFSRRAVAFNGQQVQGFEARDGQKKTVEVIDYQSNDQFVIRLRLKDNADELILAKGYDTRQPNEVLLALANLSAKAPTPLESEDVFSMPLIKLKFRRNYTEMLGKKLKNPSFTGYAISQMFENIAFELDETGASVENEAVMTLVRGAYRTGRFFYLDKPFWVIMKRADSPNPYFLLGVNNTNILQP